MKRRVGWLLTLVTVPLFGNAADLSPQDFAFGLPVLTEKDAAVYRFALPLSVYQDTVRDDLGDLRLFNAQGEAVPYSLLRRAPPSETHQAATALPLFPLRGGARVVIDGVRLSVDSPGSAVNLQTQTGSLNSAVNQYILDGRALTAPVAALRLTWPDTASDYSGRVKIEVSEDLGVWQTVVAAAPTANLHANGQALIENRVGLAPTIAKFWRISWVGPPPSFELTSVLAEPADSPVESVHAALEVEGTTSTAEADAELFDLGAHPPVSRLNVALPEANTVSTIELASRRAPGDPWRTITQAGFYRLKTQEGEQRNAPIEIGIDRDRYWRARLVRGGGLPQRPLRLHVEWVPNEVTFLARGQAPFLLVYGSATAAGAEADMAQIPTDVEIAAATLGARQMMGGAGRLAPKAAGFSWVRVSLWSALLLAVLLLGWMAFRLSHDSGGSNGSSGVRR
ncbi:MAG: DUF3999 domain-containing protein [Steroidobacteraceae bacterium]